MIAFKFCLRSYFNISGFFRGFLPTGTGTGGTTLSGKFKIEVCKGVEVCAHLGSTCQSILWAVITNILFVGRCKKSVCANKLFVSFAGARAACTRSLRDQIAVANASTARTSMTARPDQMPTVAPHSRITRTRLVSDVCKASFLVLLN